MITLCGALLLRSARWTVAAGVSFIAGVIIDKFAYHQPLYRQHVELQDYGYQSDDYDPGGQHADAAA